MAHRASPQSYLWSNWLNLILAAWLFISPWVVTAPAAGAWAWNAWIVGIVVGALSIAALVQRSEWEDWFNLVLGVWLFISPWFFGYAGQQGAAWDSYIVGILFFVIGIWGVAAARQMHGEFGHQGP